MLAAIFFSPTTCHGHLRKSATKRMLIKIFMEADGMQLRTSELISCGKNFYRWKRYNGAASEVFSFDLWFLREEWVTRRFRPLFERASWKVKWLIRTARRCSKVVNARWKLLSADVKMKTKLLNIGQRWAKMNYALKRF